MLSLYLVTGRLTNQGCHFLAKVYTNVYFLITLKSTHTNTYSHSFVNLDQYRKAASVCRRMNSSRMFTDAPQLVRVFASCEVGLRGTNTFWRRIRILRNLSNDAWGMEDRQNKSAEVNTQKIHER